MVVFPYILYACIVESGVNYHTPNYIYTNCIPNGLWEKNKEFEQCINICAS